MSRRRSGRTSLGLFDSQVHSNVVASKSDKIKNKTEYRLNVCVVEEPVGGGRHARHYKMSFDQKWVKGQIDVLSLHVVNPERPQYRTQTLSRVKCTECVRSAHR